ncbi:MAG: hypothetical protein WC533_00965 [Candidatus Pacearchaeota archaeon]
MERILEPEMIDGLKSYLDFGAGILRCKQNALNCTIYGYAYLSEPDNSLKLRHLKCLRKEVSLILGQVKRYYYTPKNKRNEGNDNFIHKMYSRLIYLNTECTDLIQDLEGRLNENIKEA